MPRPRGFPAPPLIVIIWCSTSGRSHCKVKRMFVCRLDGETRPAVPAAERHHHVPQQRRLHPLRRRSRRRPVIGRQSGRTHDPEAASEGFGLVLWSGSSAAVDSPVCCSVQVSWRPTDDEAEDCRKKGKDSTVKFSFIQTGSDPKNQCGPKCNFFPMILCGTSDWNRKKKTSDWKFSSCSNDGRYQQSFKKVIGHVIM